LVFSVPGLKNQNRTEPTSFFKILIGFFSRFSFFDYFFSGLIGFLVFLNTPSYNGYFVNGYVFHTDEYGHGRKTYNNGVCIKRSTSSEFEVDYYGKLKEVVELQYHSEQNRVFLFKCY